MTEPPATSGPLAGVTVIDFGQIFQGSYASVLMAKAGANVIKIEPPHGEPLRQRAYRRAARARMPFAMLNANKRGITLNLKLAARTGTAVRDGARRADVLLENFRAGGAGCAGRRLGPCCTRSIRRLIYATGTGYGISGPDKWTIWRWT